MIQTENTLVKKSKLEKTLTKYKTHVNNYKNNRWCAIYLNLKIVMFCKSFIFTFIHLADLFVSKAVLFCQRSHTSGATRG